MTASIGPGSYLMGSGSYLLGNKLFQGGEGAIHAIQGRPDLYAKIYLNPIVQRQYDKLNALIRARTTKLDDVAAWPIEIVGKSPSNEAVGIVVPAVTGARPLHVMLSPQDRMRDASAASLKTLAAIATNLARAVALFHDAHIVIGDLSGTNVLVLSDSNIRLIDCDSVQIAGFPCDVGLPAMLAPELLSKNLGQVVRKPDHDIFPLAVLIHQLLCLGRHPFAGNGDLTMQDAIKQNLHTLGNSDAAKAFSVTGLAPDDILSAALIRLMRRSFAPGWLAGRPSARDWASALSSYHASLKSCRVNETHWYPRHRSSCPWCMLELAGRPSFFYPSNRAKLETAQRPWWQRTPKSQPTPPLVPTHPRTVVARAAPQRTVPQRTVAVQQASAATGRKRSDSDFWAFLFIGAVWYVGYQVFFAKKTPRWEPPSYEEPAPEPEKKKKHRVTHFKPKPKAPKRPDRTVAPDPATTAYPYARVKPRSSKATTPARPEVRGIPWEPRSTPDRRGPMPWGHPSIRYERPTGATR